MADLTLTTSGNSLTLTADGESISFVASGELNTAANVGGGDAESFRDKTGSVLNFRTVSGTGGIVVSENGDVIEVDGSGMGSGETNLMANVGGGDAEVFRDKTGVTFNLRTISGLGSITVAENGDVIEISSSGSGDVVGPASATDEALVRYNLTTGKLIQDSSATLDDSGNFATPGTVDGGGGTFEGDFIVTVDSAPLADNSFLDSSSLFLRGFADTDTGAGITATAQDFELQHVVLSAGASPKTKLSFIFDTVEKLRLEHGFGGTFLGRGGVTAPILFITDSFIRLQFGGSEASVDANTFVAKSAGVTRAHYNVGSTGRTEWIASTLDSATAVGYLIKTSVLDKDTFTAGALHTEWTDAGDDTILSLSPGGDLMILGDLEHAGSNIGFYGTTPAAQSAAYTRDATIVEDRTLLASASATTLNNNNVLAALIADLQNIGILG